MAPSWSVAWSIFEKLEESAGPWIGDRLEGGTELTVDNLVVTENSPELGLLNSANIGMEIFGQFARVESAGVIRMPNVRVVQQVQEMHIYSFSVGDLATLTKAMCVDAPVRHDACLRIKDPHALGEAIAKERALPGHRDTRLAEFFKQWGHGKVEYEPLSRNIRSGPAIPPSPLKRDTRFASQSEHRIVLDPAKQGLPSRIVIKIQNPSTYFELVFRDYEVADVGDAG